MQQAIPVGTGWGWVNERWPVWMTVTGQADSRGRIPATLLFVMTREEAERAYPSYVAAARRSGKPIAGRKNFIEFMTDPGPGGRYEREIRIYATNMQPIGG